MPRRVVIALASIMLTMVGAPSAAMSQDVDGVGGGVGVDPAAGMIWAEVWAQSGGWAGSPTRCKYFQWSSALVNPGTPPRNTSKTTETYKWDLFFKSCPGAPLAPDTPGLFGTWVWIPRMPGDGAPGGLGEFARARAIEIAPKPVFNSAPANGVSYVKLGMWYWTTTPWQPIEATASIATPGGWRWVTVAATPTRLVLDPGDGKWGTGATDCAGPGEVWEPSDGDDAISPCMYTYLHSSRVTSAKQLFKPKLSIEWVVTFRSSTGGTGTLDGFTTTNTNIPAIEVKEIQAIVVA